MKRYGDKKVLKSDEILNDDVLPSVPITVKRK